MAEIKYFKPSLFFSRWGLAVTCALSDLNIRTHTRAPVKIYTCRTHLRGLWTCLGDGGTKAATRSKCRKMSRPAAQRSAGARLQQRIKLAQLFGEILG